jgi:aryl-alcohol dehydrogenase (NADP+)
MKYNQIGDSELVVSELCLGTMTFGEQNSLADAKQQLDYAISRDINFIDTAEMYPVPPRAETQGSTEEYIGHWLRHQQREKLVIATKVTGPARGFQWVRGGPRITRQHIEQAVDASLERLQTDYIDLYQIHWPDRNVPMFGQSHFNPENERQTDSIAEQLQVFSELVEAGKIRYLGLSNETPWGVSQFISVARETGASRVISIQNAFNLLSRGFESGLSEVCYHENIGLLAYSPMAFGFLSGKYLEPGATGRVTMFPGFAQRYSKVNVSDAVSEYCKLAKDAGLTPAAMALAFVREKWFVGSTIIGATTLQQLEEDIDSGSVCLSDDLIAEIDSIHQRYPNPAP